MKYRREAEETREQILQKFGTLENDSQRITSLIGLCAELASQVKNLALGLEEAGIIDLERSK